MAPVNRFTYLALAVIAWLLWDLNPLFIEVGLYGAFFYLFIIFFFLVEDSEA
jgi:hypothetical protein